MYLPNSLIILAMILLFWAQKVPYYLFLSVPNSKTEHHMMSFPESSSKVSEISSSVAFLTRPFHSYPFGTPVMCPQTHVRRIGADKTMFSRPWFVVLWVFRGVITVTGRFASRTSFKLTPFQQKSCQWVSVSIL